MSPILWTSIFVVLLETSFPTKLPDLMTRNFCYEIKEGGTYTCFSLAVEDCFISLNSSIPCKQLAEKCIRECNADETVCLNEITRCNAEETTDFGIKSCILRAFNSAPCRSSDIKYCPGDECRAPCQVEDPECNIHITSCHRDVRGMIEC